MRSPRENLQSDSALFGQPKVAVDPEDQRKKVIRIWIILLAIAAVFLACPQAAGGKERSREQIGVKERLAAERRLWELGYWAGPIDGKFDVASRHALVAFQKVERRPRTGVLTWGELRALENASRPLTRQTEFVHVEIDLTRQVLFLIDEGGTVTRILPISSGNGELYRDRGQLHRAHTPTGSFKVLRKINGWRVSTLGLLYYPSYIVNGIAIHGSLSIPPYPDSHGCIRVPIYAAKELSGMLPVGTEVIVYRSEDDAAEKLAIRNQDSNKQGNSKSPGSER
ncbi:MAG TPA: L,D-transpeptidase family protein [Pyrinomonadaceae bacterium]|nr:L,D-transpeptidase family protein [Pyrinomonadaceae bacterium]